MKTEDISEDMETENTNGNEENVGTDKGIPKGGVTKLFCKRPSAEYKYGAFAVSHEINCALVYIYICIFGIHICSRASSLCHATLHAVLLLICCFCCAGNLWLHLLSLGSEEFGMFVSPQQVSSLLPYTLANIEEKG